jgi:phosphatidate phosphatase PAH1
MNSFRKCYREMSEINKANFSVAIDVIVIRQKDDSLKSSPFFVRFGKLIALKPKNKLVNIYVNHRLVSDLVMRLDEYGNATFVGKSDNTNTENNQTALHSSSFASLNSFSSSASEDLDVSRVSNRKKDEGLVKKTMRMFFSRKKNSVSDQNEQIEILNLDETKSLRRRRSCPINKTLESEDLKKLDLKSGLNKIKYVINTAKGVQAIRANVFLWDYTDKIVITDIDGTITKSIVKGQVFTQVFRREYYHNNIAELYQSIVNNGYKIMYLSARPFIQCSVTRHILQTLRQNNQAMPPGPVIVSRDNLVKSFKAEMVDKRAHESKIVYLNEIKSFFQDIDMNPLFAGFGDRVGDMSCYREVGIGEERIFFINAEGHINHNPKLDDNKQLTFKAILENVDLYFPKLQDEI